MTCAPSEDTDQLEHPPSLIRAFAAHMNILRSLAIHWAHSKVSDQTGYRADPPSLIWVFAGCSEHFDCFFMLGHIYISRFLSLGRTHGLGRLGLMIMLNHCQLQVASNFDYRRAQSVLRSTDDFNFVGLIPRLILVCHIFSVLLSFSFQRRST